MTDEDPERLLAEALRAQAIRAPADTSPVGYGLLSGSDVKVPLPKAKPAAVETTTRLEPPRQVSAGLVLLLALLLGLAAGAVVGLLTLI